MIIFLVVVCMLAVIWPYAIAHGVLCSTSWTLGHTKHKALMKLYEEKKNHTVTKRIIIAYIFLFD